MALIFKDRVRQKATVNGTNGIVLSTPVPSYKLFSDAGLGSDSFPYCVVNDIQFEVGVGRYFTPAQSATAYGTVSRDLVLANSDGNTNLVNFNGNQADCFVTNAAELSVLVSTQPVNSTFKIIKWTGEQYDLIDPIEGGTALGATIDDSVMFYNATTTNYKADPALKFFQGDTPELYVDGVLQARAKAFVVPHPIKPGMSLHHGCLEGPEYGMYLRGTFKTKHKHSLFLPGYFTSMAEEYTIYFSSKSFMPFKYEQKDNKVFFRFMLPMLKEGTVDYLIIGRRNDLEFILEK